MDFQESLTRSNRPFSVRNMRQHIRNSAPREDGVLLRACLLQDNYRELWDQVNAAYSNPSPYVTPDKHRLELRKTAYSKLRSLTHHGDAIARDIKIRKEEIDRKITEAIGIPEKETSRASEIRAIVRGMKAEERRHLITDAIERKDGEILAAIMTAPTILTGIPETTLAGYRDHAISIHCPDLPKVKQALDEAGRILTEAFFATDNMINEIEGAAVEQRQTAAAAAAAKTAMEALRSTPELTES